MENLVLEVGSGIPSRRLKSCYYRYVKSDKLGLSYEKRIVGGFELKPIFVGDENECDFINEELDNVDFCYINLNPPDDGFIENEFYYVIFTNEKRDWETGMVEDYDLTFVHVADSEQKIFLIEKEKVQSDV